MITINHTGDRYDRSQIVINESAKDGNSQWQISLLTSDLPSKFENAQDRSVKVSIVALGDFAETSEDTNMVMLPVIVSGVSQINGQTKYFFRQRYDETSPSNSPALTLDAVVSGADLNEDILSAPYLRIEFMVNETNTDQHPGADKQTFGNESDRLTISSGDNTPHREHVDRGENSMGGFELPVGQRKSDVAEASRQGHVEQRSDAEIAAGQKADA